MTKKVIVTAGVLLCLVLAGCNTVHGIGQDVQSAGHAIERSAGK
jgi:predicted small secreted protein